MVEAAGGRVEKREAISRTSRDVFARDGYERARIETVAAEAGVSTRTIYNHFGSKEQLFLVVIRESSTEVATALIALIEDHVGDVTDARHLRPGLEELARAWVRLRSENPAHFALVRRLRADRSTMPPEVTEEWSKTGPGRVVTTLARRLRAIADRGLLDIPDPDLAAEHFLALTVGVVETRTEGGGTGNGEHDINGLVEAGVRIFLAGYEPAKYSVDKDSR